MSEKKASPFAGLADSAGAFWDERNQRERKILTLGGVAVVIGILYYSLFYFPINGIRKLTVELPLQRLASAEVQSLATQAVALKNAAAVQVEAVSQESVAASLGSRGLKPKSISVSDGFVRLQFEGVSFAGLSDWLGEQQRSTHLVLIDANFTPQKQLDSVNAMLTLKQQRTDG